MGLESGIVIFGIVEDEPGSFFADVVGAEGVEEEFDSFVGADVEQLANRPKHEVIKNQVKNRVIFFDSQYYYCSYADHAGIYSGILESPGTTIVPERIPLIGIRPPEAGGTVNIVPGGASTYSPLELSKMIWRYEKLLPPILIPSGTPTTRTAPGIFAVDLPSLKPTTPFIKKFDESYLSA